MAEKKKYTTKKGPAQKSGAKGEGAKGKGATPARKPSGSQNNQKGKQNEQKRKENPSVAGLCVTVAVALLFALMLLVKDMAVVGSTIRPLIQGFMGTWGMIPVPLYLLNLARTWYSDRKKDVVAAKWCFTVINYITVLMILHFFTADNDALYTFKGDMWGSGRRDVGTGIIGGYSFAFIRTLFGTVATNIVIWLGFLASLPVLFDTTPLRVIRMVINGLRSVTEQVADEDFADDEDEYVPEPEADDSHLGRGGVELRKPVDKPKTAEKEKKKKRYLLVDSDLPDEDAVPVAQQVEINRTRRGEKKEVNYEEIFADDGVRLPKGARDTEVYETITPTPAEPVAETVEEPVSEVASQPVDLTPEEAPVAEEVQDSAIEKTAEADADVDVSAEDIKTESAPYVFPPITLLAPKENSGVGMSPEESRRTSDLLIETLANFGVGTRLINTSHGPTVTRFELQPDTGVRVRKISNLSDDIALHLAATSVRIEAPIPGKSAVGIEIPNKTKSIVRLRELLEDYAYKNEKSSLLCCLGMDVVGNPVHLDVAKMPHLLIAGATGMGKSVCINSLIVSLLYRARPDEVKMILIDPKKVEFTDYNGIPHLLVPVVTEPKKAAGTLSWAVMEMERRFSEIQEVGARNLEEYNEFTEDDPEKEYIPQIVIIIDELADLMMTAPSEVENSICRLAQKARAAGMYLIIGTQRPSVDVITGLIKANIPSRIACKVASQVDSRTILDIAGAEKLLGKGDMLFNPVGATKPLRVQGAFVEGREVIAVCTYLKQAAEANYNEDIMQLIEKEAALCGEKGSKRGAAEAEAEDTSSIDPLELDAIEVGLDSGSISTSLLQRRLSIGYARAARIIDKLEQKGIVSAYDSTTKKRTVVISREAFAQLKMNNIDAGNSGGE